MQEVKVTIQLCVSDWLVFICSKRLFVRKVLASNREITVHALLPLRPPIVDCDKKTGKSQKVTISVVEGGTCKVKAWDGTGMCELLGGGCVDDCVVCCEDRL